MARSVYNHPRIVAGHREGYVYDKWIDSLGLPVHKGYYIEDLREVELAPWDEFECNAAIIQLEGMKDLQALT